MIIYSETPHNSKKLYKQNLQNKWIIWVGHTLLIELWKLQWKQKLIKKKTMKAKKSVILK